jgi:hypothetical protein
LSKLLKPARDPHLDTVTARLLANDWVLKAETTPISGIWWLWSSPKYTSSPVGDLRFVDGEQRYRRVK